MVRQGLRDAGAPTTQTETLLLVAKEPEALDALAGAVPDGKRAVAALVGWEGDLDGCGGPSARSRPPRSPPPAPAGAPDDDGGAVRGAPGARLLGLFSGGSLADEAWASVLDPLLGALPRPQPWLSRGTAMPSSTS